MNSGGHGPSRTATAASPTATKKNAANAVMVAGNAATERLLVISMLLSGMIGIVAFWL